MGLKDGLTDRDRGFLFARVFCQTCDAVRIRNGRSPYSVCPNGHGRLVERFTVAEMRLAIRLKLPEARRLGYVRRAFSLEGYEGVFCYRNGNGRRRANLGDPVEPGEVIACLNTQAGLCVRLFSREEGKTEGRGGGKTGKRKKGKKKKKDSKPKEKGKGGSDG